MPVTIFCCYARKDKALLNELIAHLNPLQREGLIEVWHDREIPAGTEWESEIKQHLEAAQVILRLVSPDFMTSDYCYGIEMKRALERHASGEATVIPIILRPAYWHGKPLGTLQALPTDGKPVTAWQDLDTALYDVTHGIHTVVKQLLRFERLALLQTLTGHTKAVWGVALSANGVILVSGSLDHSIKVWNLSTGQAVQTLTGHTRSVWGVALSVDGATLATGSLDGTIKVWNLSTGQAVQTLTGHTDCVYSLALSTDGATLASGSRDKTIKVWKLSTGKEVRNISSNTGGVASVALSADRAALVSGSEDSTIKVWGA